MEKESLITFAAFVILFMWAVSGIVGLITHDYEGFQIVTPVMIIFAGWVFWRGSNGVNGNGKGKGA